MAVSNITLFAAIIGGIIGYLIGSGRFRFKEVAIPLALVLFFLAAITLVLGRKDVAEQLGVYAYYFLIGGILLLFIRFVREGSGER